MQVRELSCNLSVDTLQLVLTGTNLLFDRLACFLIKSINALKLAIEKLELRIQTVHNTDLIFLTELNLDNTSGLEDTSTRIRIGVHRHLLFVDSRINNNPRSSTKFSMGRQVNVNRMLILTKSIYNHGSKLEDLSGHITTSSTESTPVCENHDRHALLSEVTDGLSGLVRGVGEENLSSLWKDGLSRVDIGRISWYDLLDQSGLYSDSSHGDTSEATTSDNYALTPSSKIFLETSVIEESLLVRSTSEHQSGIVRSRSRAELNVTINRISTGATSRGRSDILRYKTQPLKNGCNSLLVIVHNLMRYTVGEHDLGSSQLVLRIVNLTSEKFVKSRETSKDHGALLHLDDTLPKTDKVSSNSDTAPSYVTKGENLIVSFGGFSSDHTTSLQVLHSNSMVSSDNIINGPSFSYLMGIDSSLRESLVVLIGQVEVLKSLAG
mmetsp:Transcript_17265/g.25139  ORF Transcript_17265/g.25139 Transcript_17265/m.25139 type:complete len:437 (-) Transcript_17265:1240-2550(-)